MIKAIVTGHSSGLGAALAETLLAGGGTDGVLGFLAQQWLVATDHVDRRQACLQMLAELGGVQFHRGFLRKGPVARPSRITA